jgi:hypothetical protein
MRAVFMVLSQISQVAEIGERLRIAHAASEQNAGCAA